MEDVKKMIASFLPLKQENEKLKIQIEQILFDDLAEFLAVGQEASNEHVWPFRLVRLLKTTYDIRNDLSKEKFDKLLEDTSDVVHWAIHPTKRRVFLAKLDRINTILLEQRKEN